MNNISHSKHLFALALIAALATVSGCAVKGNAAADKSAPVTSTEISELSDNQDPLEPLNRGIFRFNEVVDGLVLKPAAHIYKGVLPDPVRKSVKNALTNLSAPVVFVNSALQGDTTNLQRTAGRFLINSTIGVAGLFDMASEMGIPKENKKDFGQTLGVHGVGSSPYLVLPLLGPSNVRDGVGMVADMAMDPFTYIFTPGQSVAANATRVVDRRADLLPLSNRIYRESLDPYATVRSVYQQHRQKVVTNHLTTDTNQVEGSGKKK